MNQQELSTLRQSFVQENNEHIQQVYNETKADCIRVLVNKRYCDSLVAEDHYTEAFLIFRANLISRKIEKLTSVKNYIIATAINLIRKENYQLVRKSKKESEVRLLLYDNSDEQMDDGNKSEQIEICLRALNQLTERCQQVLKAYYVHGLRMKEIAEDLELASSDVAKTIKMRCFKKWIQAAKLQSK